MKFTDNLLQIAKDNNLSMEDTLALHQTHHNEISEIREKMQKTHQDELKDMQKRIDTKQVEAGRATYKAAQLSMRALLDLAAQSVRHAHTGPRAEKCKKVNTDSTGDALKHLMVCEMLPSKLRQAIKNMEGATAREFDPEIAKIMFSHLSSQMHLAPLIRADCALIPCTTSKFERHLIIAIALSIGADWQYLNEDGVDVSELIEPGLREKVDTIRSSQSEEND